MNIFQSRRLDGIYVSGTTHCCPTGTSKPFAVISNGKLTLHPLYKIVNTYFAKKLKLFCKDRFLTAKKTAQHCFCVKCDHYQGAHLFCLFLSVFCSGSSLAKTPKHLGNKTPCPLVKMGILLPNVPPVSSTVALLLFLYYNRYIFLSILFSLFFFLSSENVIDCLNIFVAIFMAFVSLCMNIKPYTQ